jgi:hypothetical protein
VKEVHEISETLVKIRAGTFSDSEFDEIHFENSVFLNQGGNSRGDIDYSDDFYGDEYGYGHEDDDYGIENHRYIQKNLAKKSSQKKVTNKQLSNVITAHVNKKR